MISPAAHCVSFLFSATAATRLSASNTSLSVSSCPTGFFFFATDSRLILLQGPFAVTFANLTIPTTTRAFTPVSAPVIPAPPAPPPSLLGGLGHHHHSQRRSLSDLPTSSLSATAGAAAEAGSDELQQQLTAPTTTQHSSNSGRSLLGGGIGIVSGTPSVFRNIPIDTFVPATGGPFPVVLFAGGSGVRAQIALGSPLLLLLLWPSSADFEKSEGWSWWWGGEPLCSSLPFFYLSTSSSSAQRV